MANQEYRENLSQIQIMLGRSAGDEAAQQRLSRIEEQASRLRPVMGGCEMAEGLAESAILHGGRTESLLEGRPELAGDLPIGPSLIEGELTGERCFACGKDILDTETVAKSRLGTIHDTCAREANANRRKGRK